MLETGQMKRVWLTEWDCSDNYFNSSQEIKLREQTLQ